MRNTETKYENDFIEFLRIMERADCLDDIIVIGSWSEYVYERGDVLEDYQTNMQTVDLDVLIPEVNTTGERKPLVEIAKKAGYLYDEDRLTGASRFIGMSLFEVEFLTPQRGDGSRKIPRTVLGVNAQPLTHLEILKNNTMKVTLNGMTFRVPVPEAYALHKMVINERRGSKAKKDRDLLHILVPFLDGEKFAAQEEALTKKEKKMYGYYCQVSGQPKERMKWQKTTESIKKKKKRKKL